jgi:predicted CoA-binding protein
MTSAALKSSVTSAPRVDHDAYSDAYLRAILASVRTIAMVGASPRWNRPSNFAMKYLQEKGYRVIPVNPGAAGGEILGERVYANLAEIPERIDMVDLFRTSEDVGPIVEQAIAVAKEKGIATTKRPERPRPRASRGS